MFEARSEVQKMAGESFDVRALPPEMKQVMAGVSRIGCPHCGAPAASISVVERVEGERAHGLEEGGSLFALDEFTEVERFLSEIACVDCGFVLWDLEGWADKVLELISEVETSQGVK